MARWRRLLNLIVVVIGTIIVWNERRDSARQPPHDGGPASEPLPSPQGESNAPPPPASGETAAPAADGQTDVAPVPTNAAPEAAVDELAERQNVAAEARFTPGAPTAIGDDSSAAEARAAQFGTATAADPPLDAAGDAWAMGTQPVVPDPNAVPAGAVAGDGTATCPPDHPIKGNAGSMIYHRPGQPSYERTIAEFCFASEQDAEAAGYRAPKR